MDILATAARLSSQYTQVIREIADENKQAEKLLRRLAIYICTVFARCTRHDDNLSHLSATLGLFTRTSQKDVEAYEDLLVFIMRREFKGQSLINYMNSLCPSETDKPVWDDKNWKPLDTAQYYEALIVDMERWMNAKCVSDLAKALVDLVGPLSKKKSKLLANQLEGALPYKRDKVEIGNLVICIHSIMTSDYIIYERLCALYQDQYEQWAKDKTSLFWTFECIQELALFFLLISNRVQVAELLV